MINYEGYEIYYFQDGQFGYYYLQTNEDFLKSFYSLKEIENFIDNKPDVKKRQYAKKQKIIEQTLQHKVLDVMPNGWKILNGATTAPNGTVWIWNVKSRFKYDKNGNMLFKKALLVIDDELYKSSNFYKERKLLNYEKQQYCNN